MRAPGRELSTLDFLRSVAVLLVLADHLLMTFRVLDHWVFQLGLFGVLLFFVHTSYVLMMSIERMHDEGLPGLWARFMVRRCFRIYPLAIVALLTILAFHVPAPAGTIARFLTAAPTRFDWLANFTLTLEVVHARPVLLPLWSLPYELAMYLLLPALFLLARRFGPRGIALLWFAAVVLALAGGHDQRFWTARMLRFAPLFLSGVLAYALARSARPTLPFRTLPLMLLLSTIAFAFPPRRGEYLVWVLPVLAIAVLLPRIQEPSSAWLNTAAHLIAKHSYGIYISHVFCLWFAFFVVRRPWPVQLVAFAASLAVVSVALYYLVEAPMIRYGKRLTAPQPSTLPTAIAAKA